MKTISVAGQELVVRPAMGQVDNRFVGATWYRAAEQLRNVRREVFQAEYPPWIHAMLMRKAGILLLCSARDTSTILAWASGDGPNLLHFAYVPNHLRGEGLGRTIITEALGGYPERIWVTGSPLAKGHANHRRFMFNPFQRPTP
jgi:hypothetical protein